MKNAFLKVFFALFESHFLAGQTAGTMAVNKNRIGGLVMAETD